MTERNVAFGVELGVVENGVLETAALEIAGAAHDPTLPGSEPGTTSAIRFFSNCSAHAAIREAAIGCRRRDDSTPESSGVQRWYLRSGALPSEVVAAAVHRLQGAPRCQSGKACAAS